MWCQTAPSDRFVLTCTLWLVLCFIEHTVALFLRPPPIELIHDIGGVQKKVSQNPAVLAR